MSTSDPGAVMKTAGIRERDIVLVDRRGRRFEAIVSGREPDGRRFSIRPLRPAVSYMSAGAREIITHWRARPRSSGRVATRPIRAGDVVHVRIDDAATFGTVLEKDGRRLRVRPLGRPGEPRCVATSNVVRHYARQGRRTRRVG